MIDKDDEEEKGSFGQSRYPCMPSLVAQQQMKNRLHLAYLGKKLMKWTAMATARELRRICIEMNVLYEKHADEVRDCFIYLARSRYYYPNLNKIVLNDLPKRAAVRIFSTTKTVSGVRILQYSVEETGAPNYPYLAIDRGGDTVDETKRRWRALLISMVKISELRSAYILVEASNKSATKRQNVLGKMVIPRTQQSLAYIMLELQEMAREELFRIKKVVEIKKKKNAKILAALRKQTQPKQVEPEPELETIPEVPESEPEPKPVPIVDTEIPEKPEIVEPEIIEEPVEKHVYIEKPESVEEPALLSVCESATKKVTKVVIVIESECALEPTPEPIPYSGSGTEQERVVFESESLKSETKLEVIIPSKPREVEGCCAAAKLEMQRILEKYNLEEAKEFDAAIMKRLAAIKKQIEKIENSKSSIPSPDKGPGTGDSTKFPSRTMSAAGTSASMKSKPSVETRKQYSSSSYYSAQYENPAAIEQIHKHVKSIEQLTSSLNSQVAARSVERFLGACKDFEGKLREMTPKPSTNAIGKLTAQLDEAIKLSQQARTCCLDNDRVTQFIEACEEIKRQINREDRRDKPLSDGLIHKVSNVVSLLSKLRRDGLITPSVERMLIRSVPKEGLIINDDEVVDDVLLDLPSEHGTIRIYSTTEPSREESMEETIEQTVKVIKVKNPDGTITEKREIVITRQRKDPSRQSSRDADIHYMFMPDNIGFRRAVSAFEFPKMRSISLKQCISTAGTSYTGDKCSYLESNEDFNDS